MFKSPWTIQRFPRRSNAMPKERVRFGSAIENWWMGLIVPLAICAVVNSTTVAPSIAQSALTGRGEGVAEGVGLGEGRGVGVAVGRVVGVGVAVGAPLVMGVGDGVGVRVATDAVPPGPLQAASATVTAASRAPPATSNFIIDRIPSRKSPIRSNASKRACGDGFRRGLHAPASL